MSVSAAMLDRLQMDLDALVADRPQTVADGPPVWKPFPGPQSDAYECQADELFYGGAAGGGKTGLIVGLALTQHRRSLILRREAVNLTEVVDQLIEAAGREGWRASGYGGKLTTSDGRVIECNGCKDERDRENYKGRPHDLKAFDELPDFTESQYTFITAWNRTKIPGQRCRVVAAGNPPTHSGGEWVIRRWRAWLDPMAGQKAQPGDLRWYATVDGAEEEFPDGSAVTIDGEEIRPTSRTFIPSFLHNNPILSATNYRARLQSLPEPLRSAYLNGDFSICLTDDPWQVLPTSWIREAQARWTNTPPVDTPLTMAGFDVAYGGSDRSVFVPRYANWIGMPSTWTGAETDSGEKAAALVMAKLLGSKAPVNTDVIGYGAAAFESLKRRGANAIAINFGAGANGQQDARNVLTFTNMRAACYWKLRDLLDPDLGSELALPPDPDLLAELASARFEMIGGRIKIEPKEDIAERLGRSPDLADAVVLAAYEQPLGFWFKCIDTR